MQSRGDLTPFLPFLLVHLQNWYFLVDSLGAYMSAMTCNRCGKLITSSLCPHCGGEAIIHKKVNIVDSMKGSDEVNVNVVSEPSEVTIQKGKEINTYPFGPGTISGDIVTYSLNQAGLCGTTPDYIKQQLIQDIDNIERVVAETDKQQEITHEHSFELNLGIFKYKYKRIAKK